MSQPSYSDAIAEYNGQMQAQYDTFIKANPDEDITFEEWLDLI